MQLKNYLTKFMATLALCLLTTSAMAQDRLIFSHDTGQGITGNLGNVGNAIMQNYDVAMRIKDPNFVGMKIAAIRVPMENADHLSNLRVWLSKELTLKTINGKKTNVPDILSVNADITGEWVTVNLAEPYTITEEGVYVGYSFDMDSLTSTNKRPVNITTELHEGGLFVHTTRSYRNWKDMSDQCSSTMQVELDGAPLYAATPLAGNTTYFGATGVSNTLTFYAENHGATGLKSLEYSFYYDGMVCTGTYKFPTAVEPVYGKMASFEVKLPVVDRKDYYPINLTITKVNGQENSEADVDVETQVSIFDKLPKHRSVFEEYTGTWCGFCPRGYVALAAMNRLYPDDFIALSYHNSENASKLDPMEVMAGQDYPSNISGFPAAWLDRTYQMDPYGGFQSASHKMLIDNVWKAACAMPAEADIEVSALLNEAKNAVTATAKVVFPLEIKNSRYGVEYVLVADGLTGTTDDWRQHNYFYNGRQGRDYPEPEFQQFIEGQEYVSGLTFDDVVVATSRLLNNNQYLPTDVEEGHEYVMPVTFDLNQVRNTGGEKIIQDVNKLRVVALLIDYSDGTVVNAAKSVSTGQATAIQGVNADKNFQTEAVYDISGRQLSAPQKGLNIVKATDGSTRKVIIK